MKKLLVWDCDGTMWKENIIAGETPVITEKTISIIKELYSRGVVQSITSWNVERDVVEVLEKHNVAQYFLYPQIAMGVPKPIMLQTIKDELDLSKWEDIVFVDDEESHRAEALECFPGIITAPPENIDKVVKHFFTKEKYTEEDRLRVRRYEQERARKFAMKGYPGDRIEFLKSCKICVEIEQAGIEQVARVSDLIARANRMSALIVKYEEATLYKLVNLGRVHVVHVWDRFGDYGLSAVTVTRDEQDYLLIEAMVVSCRLQGKGIGSSIIAYHVNKNVGKRVYAMWVETEYNTAFADMYKFLGFGIVRSVDGLVTAKMNVAEEIGYPEWINQ